MIPEKERGTEAERHSTTCHWEGDLILYLTNVILFWIMWQV